jgi:flagellar biosynthesis chaperone FliJ
MLTGGDHTKLETKIQENQVQLDKLIQEKKDLMSQLVKLQQDLNNAGKDKTDLVKQINDLNSQLQTLDGAFTKLNTEKARLQEQLNQANLKIQDLSQKLNDPKSMIPKDVSDILMGYYTKYAEADVVYTGRYYGADPKNTYEQDVKTWSLEGQNDFKIIKKLKDNHVFVSEIMPQVNNDFHKACDIAVMRVASAISCNYYYDDQTYNTGEYWAYPTETFTRDKGDCDDWAHLRYACYRIAGVPASMLRVTCGYTYGGDGHSTNHYFASDKKWHHINSTSNFGSTNSVLNTPGVHQQSDSIGIQYDWFSYNEEKAWHQFTTASHENSFNDSKDKKFLRFIKIYPKK